jgi:hypothetical protein
VYCRVVNVTSPPNAFVKLPVPINAASTANAAPASTTSVPSAVPNETTGAAPAATKSAFPNNPFPVGTITIPEPNTNPTPPEFCGT